MHSSLICFLLVLVSVCRFVAVVVCFDISPGLGEREETLCVDVAGEDNQRESVVTQAAQVTIRLVI